MMKKQLWMGLALSATILGACTEEEEVKVKDSGTHEESTDHSSMSHSSDGSVPDDLLVANNPTYAVGDKALMTTDHMGGMNGAEATIVGAYETTVYAVTYTPTTGGEKVENHKWVIHEELEGVEDSPAAVGDTVKLNADHMEGMDGAEATVDSAEQTIIYMVDYTSTAGEEVKNHKWVTEDELTSVQ